MIVGDSGPGSDTVAATRWVGGAQSTLAAIGSSSSALFIAADGGAAIGCASVGGRTVLSQLDEPAYDRSEALDVSDDSTAVVGALQASVVSNGFPRAYGFLWSERTGLVLMTDLMVAWGQADADYYQASAISGDGLRVLAVGNTPGTESDTHSVIVDLTPY